MEWESEANLEFLRESLRSGNATGVTSLWDEYSLFNAQVVELRAERISKNIFFAERSKERLEWLAKAECDGVLFIKS